MCVCVCVCARAYKILWGSAIWGWVIGRSRKYIIYYADIIVTQNRTISFLNLKGSFRILLIQPTFLLYRWRKWNSETLSGIFNILLNKYTILGLYIHLTMDFGLFPLLDYYHENMYVQVVPIMAQWKRIWLVSVRTQVRFLASLSGLRIPHCHELLCRL